MCGIDGYDVHCCACTWYRVCGRVIRSFAWIAEKAVCPFLFCPVWMGSCQLRAVTIESLLMSQEFAQDGCKETWRLKNQGIHWVMISWPTEGKPGTSHKIDLLLEVIIVTKVTLLWKCQRRLDTVMWHMCVSEFMRSLYGGFCTDKKNDQNFLSTFFDYPKGIGIIRKR